MIKVEEEGAEEEVDIKIILKDIKFKQGRMKYTKSYIHEQVQRLVGVNEK